MTTNTKNIDEIVIAEWVAEIIEESEDFAGIVDSFEDKGIMSNNAGLVITDSDGNEFQITIVRSK